MRVSGPFANSFFSGNWMAASWYIHFMFGTRSFVLFHNLNHSRQILDPVKKTLVDFVQGRHYARLTSLSSTTDQSQFLSTSVDGLLKVWPAQLVVDNDPDLKPAAWDRKGSSKVTSAKDLIRKIAPAAPKPEASHEAAKGPIVCAASASYHSAGVSIAGREDGKFTVAQTFVLSDKDEKDFEFHMNHFREDQIPEGSLRLGCVAVSPCHNFLATTHQGTLQLWVYHPMKKGAKAPDRFKTLTFDSLITAVTFSGDEKYIMVGTQSLSLTVQFYSPFFLSSRSNFRQSSIATPDPHARGGDGFQLQR